MGKKLLAIVMLVFLATPIALFAQSGSLSGVVSDKATGEVLPGANVYVVELKKGASTDINGKYTITGLSSGSYTIEVSYVSYKQYKQTVQIGSSESTLDIGLEPDFLGLEELVVTGAGIKRQSKALGYGVTKIEGEKLVPQAESDVSRILRGQAPGVSITATSGTSGAATNIVIRGFTSITGSNQPLFVVDGVPFDAGTNSNDSFADVSATSSRFLDIDPNNIKSLNVLKGLSATVLYGDRGRNGVILIETNTGSASEDGVRKKMEVSVNQSIGVNEIASLPDYNQNYGNGFHATNAATFFSNWGGNIARTPTIPHPYSTSNDPAVRASFPEFQGADYEYKYYNSVEEFFRRGVVSNTSFDVSGSSDRLDYGVTYSNNLDQGFTPGNELNKDALTIGGTYRLMNNFTVKGSILFANTNVVSPPISASRGSGSGSGLVESVFGDLFYTPTTIDLMGLPFQNSDGSSAYYRGGNDIQNPRWTAANAFNNSDTRRTFMNMTATYEPADWITFTYRYGQDVYDEDQEVGQNRGGAAISPQGIYRTRAIRSQIINHEIFTQVIRQLSENLSLNAVVGTQFRQDEFETIGVTSQNQVAFGVTRHFNFQEYTGFDSFQSETRVGVYGQGELGFKDYLYLTVAARNDWTSTLEMGNNAQLYPSVSLAMDVTNAIESLKNSKWLSYAKVRAAYGSSANFPGPYATRNVLALNSRAFVDRNGGILTTNLVSNALGNPNLRPELVEEVELGIELNMFENRIRTDISIYQKNTNDLLLNQLLDPGTGFTSTLVNAGEIETKGLEIDLTLVPVKSSNFEWELRSRFFTDANTVISLPDGTNQIQTSGYTDIGNFQIPGQPFNLLRGIGYQRADGTDAYLDQSGNPIPAGTVLIDPGSGSALESQDLVTLGNPNPVFTNNISNTFNYKNWSLFVDVEYRHGGDLYSQTATTMMARGVTADTDFDRRESYIIDGVYQVDPDPAVTGDEYYTNNDIIITSTSYYFDHYLTPEGGIFDGTTLRLNNASLTYRVPKKALEKTPFGSLSFTAWGNNLWFKAINMPEHVNFDTNVLGVGVGNAQGLEFLNGPSRRSYGVSARLTF